MTNRKIVSKWETGVFNVLLGVIAATAVVYPYAEVEVLGAEPTLFDPVLFYGGLLLWGSLIRISWLNYKHREVEYRGFGMRTIVQRPEQHYEDIRNTSEGDA